MRPERATPRSTAMKSPRSVCPSALSRDNVAVDDEPHQRHVRVNIVSCKRQEGIHRVPRADNLVDLLHQMACADIRWIEVGEALHLALRFPTVPPAPLHLFYVR